MRLARRLLPFGAALLLAACAGSDKDDPDLVFVSTRDGDYALYTMSASGGEERRLSETEGDPSTPAGLFFQTDPAWSPDGATIAFASKRSGSFDLYAIGADGSDLRRLTSTKDDDDEPTWSPDGEWIAFARGASSRLFVMAADGSGARRLTDEEREEGEPAWSPDGRWIAYSSKEPGSSIRELWLVRPDGSQRRQLTRLGGAAQAPAWSPDGTRLAFSAKVEGSRFDIYTVRVNGRGAEPLTSRGQSFEPAWSPDGKTIVFSDAGALVAIDVESGEERILTDADNNDGSPAWAPRPETES